MDSARLAQAFNRVGQHLSGQGHRIVIRRARELVREGDLAEASRFLEDAATRLVDNEVRDLHGSFSAWHAAGGQPAELMASATWTQGAAAEDRVSDLIGAATDGDLPALVEERVNQQAALDRGDDLAAPSAPSAPPAAGSGRHAIGNVFGDRPEPQAVVEAPSKLQPRDLNLGDDVVDAADLVKAPATVDPMAATEVMPNAAAAVRALTQTPPPPPKAPESDLPDPFAAAAAAPPSAPPPASTASGGFSAPELKAPPSLPTSAKKADGGGSSTGLIIGAVLLAAAAAAAWFFLGR